VTGAGGESGGAFGALLRGHRRAAGLTQEALAERAGLSRRGLQHLEAGDARPYPATLDALAAALALGPEDRARLRVAARTAAPPPADPADGRRGRRPPAAGPSNLPIPPTPLVGRGREVDLLRRLLGAPAPVPSGAPADRAPAASQGAAARLVTLTGPPGIGKTRLALAVAASLVEAFPGGVWLVELAALADAALVPQAVAAALGVREEPGRPPLATLVGALRPRHLLLVLDNCEHLVEACARLAEALLAACPRVQVLATSREALGIAGEVPFRVPPLALPPRGAGAPVGAVGGPAGPLPAEALTQWEAAQLFVGRAQTLVPGFAVTAQNAGAIAQLCHRLDGIPLAIELAAARVRLLSVEQLLARVEDRFRLLTGGSRTAQRRQQTLRALVDWSYDLLAPPERALFDRLSDFAGGFSLEAAEAVCVDGEDRLTATGDGPVVGRRSPVAVSREDVLDLLGRLVDKSLVQTDGPGRPDGTVRHRLLETLRQYGRERLVAGGEAEATHARHAAHYLAVAEAAAPHLHGPAQAAWLDRLEAEHDNLRQALQWLLDRREAAAGMRLAAALRHFWLVRGFRREGRGWLAALLAVPDTAGGAVPPRVRGRALLAAGFLAGHDGDRDEASERCRESLALLRAHGDRAGTALSLQVLGLTALAEDDPVTARPLLEEALAIRRAVGDREEVAHSLNHLAMLALREGDLATAGALPEESLAIRRAAGDAFGVAGVLTWLASLAHLQDDTAAARDRFRESLALYQAIGARAGILQPLCGLALTARDAGEFEEARRLLEDELAAERENRSEHDAIVLRLLAGIVAAELGDHARAGAVCAEGLALGRLAGGAPAVAIALDAIAWVAATWGEPGRALRLAAAAGSATAKRLDQHMPLWQVSVARRLEPCRRALGGAAADAALAEGQAMALDRAVAYALATLEPRPAPAAAAPAALTAGTATGGPADRAAPPPGGLSAREREVAALVAQGLTNRQIAAALVITRATASRHVEHVLAKLGVHSRAQIATWATEYGLTRSAG
jgi:non-specific serine/threonine protein kinase